MDLSYNVRLFKEIFFPRKCGICGTGIDTGLLCDSCRKSFLLQKVKIYGADRDSWQRLRAIGQPLVAEDYFDRMEYLYRYDGIYKEALHNLKFEQEKQLLPLLKEEAELALKVSVSKLLRHYDYVTCIPTSEERRAQRGFDVPWEIFVSLQQGKVQYTDKLLQRVKSTAPLYAMDVIERQAEIAGCFRVLDVATVKGKRILLCDDIYTTGTTMMEAAEVLFKAGAKAVGVLTLCASKDNW